MTGMSLASVRRWRRLGQGPKWIRVGLAAIRYRAEDVLAFLESRPTGGGSQPESRVLNRKLDLESTINEKVNPKTGEAERR